MAAGLGFKTFTTGEVLTAADTNGYLMQGVLVFASAAARDAAITSPQEGQFAYLKDTNVTTYYTGSAWTNLDTTGMTNPMTTTGDVIYSSPGSTPVRLGIGSTGNVLTVSGGVPVWSAPAGGGGMTLLSTTALSGTSTTISSISGSYNHLNIELVNVNCSAAAVPFFRINGITTTVYFAWNAIQTSFTSNTGATNASIGQSTSTASNLNGIVTIPWYSSSTSVLKTLAWQIGNNFTGDMLWGMSNVNSASSAVTSFTISTVAGTSNLSGTINIYGVK